MSDDAKKKKRAEYMREYRRRVRTKAAAPDLPAVYVCTRYPGLAIGGLRFVYGLLVAETAADCAKVEGHVGFGDYIFRLK